jgi:hypothetical protein
MRTVCAVGTLVALNEEYATAWHLMASNERMTANNGIEKNVKGMSPLGKPRNR